LFCREVYSNHV